jgi:hypothetical protein
MWGAKYEPGRRVSNPLMAATVTKDFPANLITLRVLWKLTRGLTTCIFPAAAFARMFSPDVFGRKASALLLFLLADPLSSRRETILI